MFEVKGIKLKRIILISAIVVVSAYLLCLVIGACIVLYDAANLDKKLDNKYIDNDFYGWKKLEVDYGYDLMIPGEWKITEKSGNKFLECNGEVVAYVKVIKSSDYVETKTFFQQLLNVQINEFVECPAEGFTRIDLSSLCRCVVNEDDTFYHLQISRSEHDINIVFTSAFESEDEIVHIAQAITYSALRPITSQSGDG